LTKGSSQPPVASVFLSIRVVDADLAPPPPAPPIENLLNDGLTVQVPCGFDPRTLNDILAVLEASPC